MQNEVSQIKQRILQLPINQQQDLTDWLSKMHKMDRKKVLDTKGTMDDWDKQMLQDADDGLLDFLYEEAIQEKKMGALRELP